MVDFFVAEIGDAAVDDQIYRLTYDGQVADEHRYAVMGGQAEAVAEHLKEHYVDGAPLVEALRMAVAALGHGTGDNGAAEDRIIPTDDLEVAVLDRTRTQPRKFARVRPARLDALLGERDPVVPPGQGTDAPPATEEGQAPAAPSGPEPASTPTPPEDEPPIAPPT